MNCSRPILYTVSNINIFSILLKDAYGKSCYVPQRLILIPYFVPWIFAFVCRASHLGLLYLGSLAVLLVYSILYGLTAKDAHWLGAITSAAVIILGMLITTMLIFY